MLRRVLLPLVFSFASVPLPAQTPTIAVIDFYGLGRVPAAEARRALGFAVGDSVPAPARMGEAKERLEALPGVAVAHFSAVCCEQGGVMVYVGIEQDGAPAHRFRPAPTGDARLPDDVLRAGEDFQRALMRAVQAGSAEEDASQGHALMKDSAARAVQERFVGFAARDLERLRAVLRGSADAAQRALAAQVLGYAPDKRAVVGDLVEAMRDPDESVRNNAMRALALIAALAQRRPERGIRVPPEPFVALLTSPVWTDRNKASFALMELTQTRGSTLMSALRAGAVPALIDMAQWKSPGHALPAFLALGRVAGLSDDEIMAAWSRGDRDAVIDVARKGAP